MKQVLVNYFKAAFPAVAIQTTEEARACADVIAAAKEVKRGVITWSATEGMVDVGANGAKIADTEDLEAACKQRRKNTIYIVRDPHTWPMERLPVLLRAWRDFLQSAPNLGSTVVILAHEYKPHPTCEKLVVVLDYTLPSPEDLGTIAKNIANSAKKPDLTANDEVLRALGGLTTTEAENACALSLVETSGFDPKIIYREKIKAVKKSGLLDIIDPDPRGMESIGGLDALKSWIGKRRRAWLPEAEAFGLPAPKGILIVGVPGVGKSLTAKAIGTTLGIPTLRLDIGAMFNSLVGESEARIRDALKLAEAIAPCVLWVDELEKGFAGASGSGSGDSGVGKRVFGTVITWLQERRKPVFMVATANDVTALPPELLRKGRFDEIFAVDLPTDSEREEILGIHLVKRKRKPQDFDLVAAAEVMQNFTGSEIEAVLNEALFAAFDARRELSTTDIIEAAKAITPLAVTAKEQIEAIRQWGRTRARFAATPQIVQQQTSSRKMSV